MPHRLSVATLAAMTGVSLILSGCGRTDMGLAGSDGAAGSGKTATIGVISPLSGRMAAMGLGIQHSVELAVQQSNASNAIPGWTLKVAAKDDEGRADVAGNAANALVADPSVVGVVGAADSQTTAAVQPILTSAGITQVSPSSTTPALTRGTGQAPTRPSASFFRTIAPDSAQGPFAARYLRSVAKVTQVAVLDDGSGYGRSLSSPFATEFSRLGGSVVNAQTVNPAETNLSGTISGVQGATPGAVFYGGEYPQGALLSKQLAAAGVKAPVSGGDGLYDPEFIKRAGKAAAGDLAVAVGAPTSTLPGGKKYLSDYTAAGYPDAPGVYGAYAYDAAQAIISSLRRTLKDATDPSSARQPTIAAMKDVNLAGATGQLSFDEFGDARKPYLSVYKVIDGRWAMVQKGTL